MQRTLAGAAVPEAWRERALRECQGGDALLRAVFSGVGWTVNRIERDYGTDYEVEVFRDGVRVFLRRHAMANARWSDLVVALEDSSGVNLERWSESWILTAGMEFV